MTQNGAGHASADDEDFLRVAERIELPESTLDGLRAGIPKLLRAKGWPGPALFQSELGEGVLRSSAEPDALLTREGEHEAYLLGSVRLGPKTPPLSVFALRKGSGEVVLLDAHDPSEDRFVNASLAAFLGSMLAFHGAFDHLMTEHEGREKHVASFRELLERIDARALDDAHNYWPGWLVEMQ